MDATVDKSTHSPASVPISNVPAAAKPQNNVMLKQRISEKLFCDWENKQYLPAGMLRRHVSIPDKVVTLPAPLQPPEGYYEIDDGLYRATSVHPATFSFLDNLKLKSVLLLSGDKPDPTLKEYVSSAGIEQIRLFDDRDTYVPSMRYSETEELIKIAVEMVIDGNNSPLLLLGGPSAAHFDVLIIGTLRRLLNWSLSSILSEVRLLIGKPLVDVEQFIEHCDVSLIQLPVKLPHFLQIYLALESEESTLFEGNQPGEVGKHQELRNLLGYRTGAVISKNVQYDPNLSLVTGEDDA